MRHARQGACSAILLGVIITILLAISSGCVKHYKIEGLILQVDPTARTILVSHRPIDKYMPAMTMPFHVAPDEDLSTLTPGTRINFDLSVGKLSRLRDARIGAAALVPAQRWRDPEREQRFGSKIKYSPDKIEPAETADAIRILGGIRTLQCGKLIALLIEV